MHVTAAKRTRTIALLEQWTQAGGVLLRPGAKRQEAQPAQSLLLLQVSAFITAAQVKFLLLHDGKSDDTIKQFFKDVYEVYMRVMLNPFFNPGVRITSAAFTQRVKSMARMHFR